MTNSQRWEADRSAGWHWSHFYLGLRLIARDRLERCDARQIRVVDESEDIALSTLNSFFRRLDESSFPDLSTERNYWCVLRTILKRKVQNRVDEQLTMKRGGRIPHVSLTTPADSVDHSRNDPMIPVADRSTPSCADQLIFEEILDAIPCEMLRRVIELKLDGHTHEAIVKDIGKSPRMISVYLDRICKILSKADLASVASSRESS